MPLTMLIASCRCGREQEARGSTEHDCLEQLREAGWRRIGMSRFDDHWECPQCKTIIKWCETEGK